MSELVVRPATLADAAALAAIYAPMVVGEVSTFELEPPTPEQMAGRMSSGLPWLVAQWDDAVCGYAYASTFRDRPAYRWTVETSVRVAPTAQGRGLGRALYARLLDELTTSGFAQAIAVIALPNDPSVALHQALGFTRVGVLDQVGRKLGRWVDVELWQRSLGAPC